MTVREWAGRFQGAVAARPGFSLRVGVIALLLIASLLLVPAAALGEPAAWLVLGSPLALAALAVLLRWPGLLFPLAVISGMLVPFSLATGSQTGINATIMLLIVALALWGLDLAVGRAELRLDASPTFLPLIALIGVSILALGFGQLPWFVSRPAPFTAQLGGLGIILLSGGAFLLAAQRLEDLQPLRWMVYLFLGLGAVFIFMVLVPSLRQPAIGLFQRAVLDAMFWTWIVALGAGQALLNQHLPMRWRIACGLVVLGALYFTIIDRQSWTSGWLPGLVAIATILATRRPRWLLIGVAVLLVGAILSPQAVNGILLGGDNAYSLETRLEAWGILLRMVRLNPILGLGPANYYNYTPLFSILGYSVSFNSHNNYLDLLAQTGVAGLACFLWLTGSIGRTIWRIRDRLPDGFPRVYADSALAGLAGMFVAGMLGDWLIPFVYNVGLEGLRAVALAWMFLGAAVALERMYLGGPATPRLPVGETG